MFLFRVLNWPEPYRNMRYMHTIPLDGPLWFHHLDRLMLHRKTVPDPGDARTSFANAPDGNPIGIGPVLIPFSVLIFGSTNKLKNKTNGTPFLQRFESKTVHVSNVLLFSMLLRENHKSKHLFKFIDSFCTIILIQKTIFTAKCLINKFMYNKTNNSLDFSILASPSVKFVLYQKLRIVRYEIAQETIFDICEKYD